MALESIQLFERLEKVRGENALTEAFAACLRVSQAFQKLFLQRAEADDQILKIETQSRDAKSKKIPDVEVQCNKRLLFFEIKENDQLRLKQWNDYRAIADERGFTADKSVYAILAPWANCDGGIRPKRNIWRWTDIYEIAKQASNSESSEVGVFLLRELMDFLGRRGMKPFDGFSQEDLSVLLKLPSVNSKMETFFSGIVNEIRKSLTTLHNEGYDVGGYKGCDELYPGVTIKLGAKGYEFKAWVGLECASQGISFTLWLWAEDMWLQRRSRQTKKLERILNDLGFKWDKSEGYYRSLKNRLHSPEESMKAVKGIARDVEKLLVSVLSKLQRKNVR